MLQPIKDVEGFKKDIKSNAVLSVDHAGLAAYKNKKKHTQSVIDDINNIKQELGELKDMLKLIISSREGTL